MKNSIIQKSGVEVYDFFSTHIEIQTERTVVMMTNKVADIVNNKLSPKIIINLSRTNDIRYINKFFEAVNAKLNHGGYYIGCFETLSSRRERLPQGTMPLIGGLVSTTDFLINRVLPKTIGLKRIYYCLTQGRIRLLSKAEALGRLVCCGFEIIACKTIKGLTYFVARKVKAPTFDMHPSYGAFYKMPRMGKNGKTVGIYKLRTMHPYSEYLQDYVLKQNGYAASGKPAEDFRLTSWGKFMRKYWLDELPQLLNLLKGELKLVGVRPITTRYFQDLPDDLKKLRMKQKPGCIPPYVALNKGGSLENVIQSESDYLMEKARNPYFTDTKYFFMAVYNILVRQIRSA